jgi:signal transduction histidine kinase
VRAKLEAVSRVLCSALARRRAEGAVRASEAMKSSILSSLTNAVLVIDRRGEILTVNERWRQMAKAHLPPAPFALGADYLEFLRDAGRAGELWAAEVATGITAVLHASSPCFRLEYRQPCVDGHHTLVVRAMPLDRAGGGAVITYVDITDQRRAEHEAQQARSELAHVSRVATMGALTASIAHQLNQPLTGILLNAQAARRFLAAPQPDLPEVSASLEHIIEDERRASDVIVRMRDFLRKDHAVIEDIDLNALVAGVARLVGSDAVFRNVALALQLDGIPAVVRGDPVQLQQVVLNLIVNALEAFGEGTAGDRRIVVRSARLGEDFVEISVSDTGPGFSGPADGLFDAFYTTKPGGMGLGLSIARSIVEAHAGTIHLATERSGGATVAFKLPLAHQFAG